MGSHWTTILTVP